MEWRGIAAKVLVFVMGAAGIVLVVFVAAPWLEAPDQPAVQPPSRDAVVKGALASFGEADAGEADGETVAAAGVTVVPSPLLAAGAENPVPSPAMEVPAVAAPGEFDAGPAQGAGLPNVLPPQEAAVVTSEPVRVASAPDVEMGDGPLAAGTPAVEADRIAEPMPAAPEATAPYEAVEELEPASAETVAAGKEAAPGAVDVPVPIAAEPVPAEPVQDAQQLSGEVFRETEAARQSSRAGLPRLEFEAPGGIQVVETPLGVEYPPAASKATAPPQSDPVVVPGTLRGVMGYRMPLVSRQALPDQVVSGVLIPAHTTYVILQPGYWELVGLSPDEVNVLRAAAEKTQADEPAARSEPPARSWNPFRLFRRNRTPANGE